MLAYVLSHRGMHTASKRSGFTTTFLSPATPHARMHMRTQMGIMQRVPSSKTFHKRPKRPQGPQSPPSSTRREQSDHGSERAAEGGAAGGEAGGARVDLHSRRAAVLIVTCCMLSSRRTPSASSAAESCEQPSASSLVRLLDEHGVSGRPPWSAWGGVPGALTSFDSIRASAAVSPQRLLLTRP